MAKSKDSIKRNLILGAVAILIIIIILYLISTIGVITSEPLGTSCVADSSYLCQSAVLSSATGNLTITLGQNTGSNWDNVYFDYILGNLGGAGSFVPATSTYISTLYTGVPITTNLSIAKPGSLTKGQIVQGSIWAKYTVNGTNQTSYAQIASINIKAT